MRRVLDAALVELERERAVATAADRVQLGDRSRVCCMGIDHRTRASEPDSRVQREIDLARTCSESERASCRSTSAGAASRTLRRAISVDSLVITDTNAILVLRHAVR